MTQPISQPAPLSPAVVDAVPVPLTHRPSLTAIWAVFWLTLRQHCRARRLLILAFLFLLPAAIAILVHYADPLFGRPWHFRFVGAYALEPTALAAFTGLTYAFQLIQHLRELEFALVFTFIPHAIVPLTALLYASGMIQDEIEEQTLTYLLIRPSPRWAIYTAKLLATLLITTGLATFFILLTYGAIYWSTPGFSAEIVLPRAAITIGIQALALVAYCALFGCLSLFVKRSLVIGVAYIILFEGVLANIDFIVRRLTINYYFRVLIERWHDLNLREWSINLDDAPSAESCVWTILGMSLILTILAARTFAGREFRMKTPEGS
jgi:ABC-2 type transport system permease protein